MAKILLVDDDQTLSKMVHDWLVFDHHQVETASDGDDGLYKVLTYSYDIIVLELNMPEKKTASKFVQNIEPKAASHRC